jgi:hypothetical protein
VRLVREKQELLLSMRLTPVLFHALSNPKSAGISLLFHSLCEDNLAILRTTKTSKPHLLAQPRQQSPDHGWATESRRLHGGMDLHNAC